MWSGLLHFGFPPTAVLWHPVSQRQSDRLLALSCSCAAVSSVLSFRGSGDDVAAQDLPGRAKDLYALFIADGRHVCCC